MFHNSVFVSGCNFIPIAFDVKPAQIVQKSEPSEMAEGFAAAIFILTKLTNPTSAGRLPWRAAREPYKPEHYWY